MTTTNNRPHLAPAPLVPRGFGDLPCVKCGETEGLSITLHDLTHDAALHCTHCEGDYGVEDVRATLEGWARVLNWLDLSPEVAR